MDLEMTPFVVVDKLRDQPHPSRADPAVASTNSRCVGNGEIVAQWVGNVNYFLAASLKRKRMEKLRAFVKKVMKEQGLSEWQIEKRSGSRITDSYVKDIISGKAKSIGVDKLNALALGLGVDSVMLFKIASRADAKYVPHSWPPQGISEPSDPWPSHELSEAIDKIIHSPELTDIVKKLLVAKPSKLKALARELEKS